MVLSGDGEVLAAGTVAEVLEVVAQAELQIYTLDSALLTEVCDAYVTAGQFARLDISLRGGARGTAPQMLGIRRQGWPASWRDLACMVPDNDTETTAAGMGLQLPGPLAPAADQVMALADFGEQWLSWLEAELGCAPGVTLASTAAKLGIPRLWRDAFRARPRFSAEQLQVTQLAEQAYYGGRVTCRQPGWTGEAVEYDLRSAYGWALTQPLPDWKGYLRKPWHTGPAWYDCTVDTSCAVLGPLPVRDPRNPARLSYPRAERLRGTWTRDELDRAGVRVVEVHQVGAGRWSRDLAPMVETWLQRREDAGRDPLRRALYRFLPNALAGKLVQRSTAWVLWPGRSDQIPPDGAIPLGLASSLWAVPVVSARQPVTCPQAGSYVTSLVRSRVWPELQRQDALYSDTDSIHLPADAPPPAGLGDHAGQWSRKEAGPACYVGLKHYKIGQKVVRPPFAANQFLQDEPAE